VEGFADLTGRTSIRDVPSVVPVLTAPRVAANAAPARFRQAASCVPTGVSVVTCVDERGQVYGMTANSFVSVSLDPPTALVSIHVGRMHSLIARHRRYGISVLGEQHENLSRHFAGHAGATLIPEYTARSGMPILSCAIAYFVLDIVSEVHIVDHTLFVGTVIECGHSAGLPLLFFASRYRRMAS
jgi:flavin reductase (DIM6/NTAB) family NADH-FMN oxidoreductase RutF